MTDWTTARVTPETLAELRRLLEEATPGPWHAWDRGIGYEVHTEVEHNPIRCDPLNSGFRETFGGPDAHLIVSAVNALPSLLDQLDAAEAALARVRELHERESFWQYHRDQEHSYPTQQDAADDSGCDCPWDPDSVYLAHTAECLATISHFDVCSECARIEYADADRQAHGEFSGYAEALWPCPTIRAIGGEQS